MINITQEQLYEMCAVISHYKEIGYQDSQNGGGISWQFYAGLSGVGDITLIADNEQRLAHVNTDSFQNSEEGQFLIDAIGWE